MIRALPSELRRMAVLRECSPVPDGPLAVVIAAAAVGVAIDAHSQRSEWQSLTKHRMDVLAYGEEAYSVLAQDHDQADIVREGWALIVEWSKMIAPAVTEEALEEAVDPTVAGSSEPTDSNEPG